MLERGGKLDLIEVKWNEEPGESDAASLHAVSKALATHSLTTRPGRLWLVCRTPHPYTRADGVRVTSPIQAGEISGT
ncbi:MAG: hypothetical protein ACOYM2_09805 [Rectinemataceae bacterium]